MACCYNVTRFFVVLFILLGLVGVVLAGLVDYWWQLNYRDKQGEVFTAEKGLWRTCGGLSVLGEKVNICQRRQDLLTFSSRGEEFNLDIIVVSLIGSAFFSFISLILVAVTMCQRYPIKLMVLFHLIFLLLGIGGGVFGLVWAMIKFSRVNQSWAFYILYAGDGCLAVAFFLSMVLLCARAPGYYLVAKRHDDEMVRLK